MPGLAQEQMGKNFTALGHCGEREGTTVGECQVSGDIVLCDV